MNRHNLFGHIALAVALIILAAFIGQMRRLDWRTHNDQPAPRADVQQPAEAEDKDDADKDEPEDVDDNADDAEVLVRFRAGTSQATIDRITAQFNDRVEDRFEQIDNAEMVIADEDGSDINEVVAEYRNLPEVLYAEPNFQIDLEPGEDEPSAVLGGMPVESEPRHAGGSADHPHPSDPMFDDQWSLDNHGTRGGKEGADINAIKAWTKTHGSQKVVVAVLDTGVDYTHLDLVNNIWTRPASVPAYADKELGSFDDA